MKIIVARLFNFAGILGVIGLITLSGCGVKGPLYFPKVPPAPQQPAEPEPKGQQWPTPSSPANASPTTNSSTK